jgi:8-amino-7-oxononanoate synthase
VIGDEDDTVAAAVTLLAAGVLVPAIRPPTVPPGTSRLRIALSAAHTDAEIAELSARLDDTGWPVGVATGPAEP